MKLFRLEGPPSWRGALVNIRDTKARFSSYFLWDEGNNRFLEKSKASGMADPAVHYDALVATDYLPTNIGVPMFSPSFHDAFTRLFPKEAEFYEGVVYCHGKNITCFLCKAKSYIPLISETESTFRLTEDGEPLLQAAVYKTTIDDEFLLARDIKFRTRLVVSGKFVEFCQQNSFRISFGNPI